ncbi:hypothetical protein [Actinoplanes sp. NPDC020271]|uniref:hypothetical protein n=1 Tax=Actinoplanes sp. NPDC020271 TaxID=3363896 RepID=UPI00378F4434
MTARRLFSLTAVVALVAAAAAVLVLLGRAALTPGDPPSPLAAAAEPSSPPAPVPSEPAPPPPGKPVPAATPPANPVPAAAPAPFVQHFASGATAGPLPRRKSPTATVDVPAFVDGCDHNYGTPTQCVPLTFPPGVTDRCAWLAAHGFTQLLVAGRDDQHLDPDGDGTACD